VFDFVGRGVRKSEKTILAMNWSLMARGEEGLNVQKLFKEVFVPLAVWICANK